MMQGMPEQRLSAAHDSSRRSRPGFRADIEGLRAVAILMVAVYHVWVGRVSGGVDVFLMISGFFVGASVVRSYSERRAPSLWSYYARVFGRLLPAAALVLVTVVLSTWLLLPRTRMTETVQQAVASLLYYENWYLATTGREYGAADASQSMTQHFWSLSVQGQLFVAVPLLMLLLTLVLRRFASLRVLVSVVATLMVASFAYATYLVQVDQGLAYYSTFARAWQMLFGTVLAFVVVLGPVRRMPHVLRAVLGVVGAAAIVLTGVVVDGLALFPGPAALLPLLGAAAVVVAGAGDRSTPVTRALSVRPLVRAGGSAYGFYLWHWPVLVLVVTLRDEQPGWLDGTMVLAAAALLTWGTEVLLGWRPRWTRRPVDVAEVPAQGCEPGAALRARRPRRGRGEAVLARMTPRTLVGASAAVAVLVSASAWTQHVEAERAAVLGASDLDVSVYPGALTLVDVDTWPAPDGVDAVPEPVLSLGDWPARERSGCTADIDEETVYSCEFGTQEATRRVALVGGSHAVSFVEPLDAVAQVRGIHLDAFFKRGCPLRLLDVDDSSCTQWSQNVIDTLLDVGYDAVVVTGTRPDAGGGDYVPPSYVAAWSDLEQDGIPVIAIRDNPWMPFDTSECLVVDGPQGCTVPRADVLDVVNPLDAVVEIGEVSATVDLSDLFCDEDTCLTVVGNVQVYIDADHLTATFSRTLAGPLDERFGAATGWW